MNDLHKKNSTESDIILAHRLLIKLKYVKYVHILKQIVYWLISRWFESYDTPYTWYIFFSLSLYRKKL